MTRLKEWELLTVGETAAVLKCSTATVYRAIERGQLEARRLGQSGPFRVTDDAINRYLLPAQRN
jgi:excisionase family DNA binding protein